MLGRDEGVEQVGQESESGLPVTVLKLIPDDIASAAADSDKVIVPLPRAWAQEQTGRTAVDSVVDCRSSTMHEDPGMA